LTKVIADAKAIGNRYIVCAYIEAEERRSLDDYRQHDELFNLVGETCRVAGIQFAYHNHDFEFEPIEGKIPFQVLLAETDPALVKIEMGLYWITKGGGEPFEYFEANPGRFVMFHVKGIDATPRRHTEVGRDSIHFERIFSRAEQAGAKHFFVEQDESPRLPARQRSRGARVSSRARALSSRSASAARNELDDSLTSSPRSLRSSGELPKSRSP